MASIGRELKTKGVIMTLLSLVLMNIGCEDNIGNPAVNPSEGKTVEVTLHIGFANEADGYTVATKSGTSTDKGAFNYELQPNAMTKGTASVKPDQLYNLEIQQYDQAGKRIGGMSSVVTQQAIGSAITLSLAETPDCQLVLVAWGDGNTTPRLGTSNTLEAVQKLSVDASVINNIPVDNMNKMPYILHLEHVKVSDGKLQSVDGEDVRLLLKRLAARLTLNWTYLVSGESASYKLKQILLESIPTNYNIIPNPDKSDETYPSLLDQFTTLQVDASGKSSLSCWIPANVRGTNPAATSQTYRIKSNAPTGSSYVSFIAVNDEDAKKKLNYRVYLGGRTTFDFNLYSNTNYNYEVNFNHRELPTNDRRVTIVDPIPASQNNDNQVPTANCFMVAPGGAFCFNPLMFRQNNKDIENATLKGWIDSEGAIAYVKLLWQTKENGDVGDPVMGVANSETDHTNIVDMKNGLIYCRVAPNTTGGSGLIAAYNSKDQIMWSWHVWVTDYAPDAKTDVSVDETNKRVQKYTYGGKTQYPMMDRNLGALEGYTEVPIGSLARSKANGFHYQWGRKDPFPSSYSASSEIYITLNSDKPTKGMLNLYQPDGVSYFIRKTSSGTVSLRNAYQNPTVTYSSGGDWCNEIKETFWNSSENKKTFNDPCPAGWRIASKINYRSFFTDPSYEDSGKRTDNVPMNMNNKTTVLEDGGAVIYFENQTDGRSTYIRLTGYQEYYNQFNYIGGMGNLWCREYPYLLAIIAAYFPHVSPLPVYNISSNWAKRDGYPLRCIQDR